MKVSKQPTTNVQYQPHLLYYAGNIINFIIVLLQNQAKFNFGLLDPTVDCWQLCHCTLTTVLIYIVPSPDSVSQIYCHPHCMRNVLAALQSVLESSIADGRP